MLIARARVSGSETYGVVEGYGFTPIDGTPYAGVKPAGADLPLSSVTLLAPVVPSRVLVVLGGFLAEGAELPPGAEPVLFPKVVTRHRGPGDEVITHAGLTEGLLMEAELALVIGRKTRSVSPEEAWESILGYTVYNDFTAAEYLSSRDFYLAKSMDTFGCVGPWITTELDRDRIAAGLDIIGRVNGEVQQRGTTRLYKFDPGEIVSHASRYVTLMPGDIISLGTPPPPAPIAPGDVVEAEVEGVGVLRTLVAEAAPSASSP